MENINNANSIELDLFNSNIIDIKNQMLVETATVGLSRWENILGLESANSYNIDYRRTRILGRLKGQGTFTIKFIEDLTTSFENAEVEVTEDNASYSFSIKFVGIKGIVPNLDDLKSIIEEFKPAHLGVNYVFTYLTWNEFNNYNKAWSEWNSLNLNWSTFEAYKE